MLTRRDDNERTLLMTFYVHDQRTGRTVEPTRLFEELFLELTISEGGAR